MTTVIAAIRRLLGWLNAQEPRSDEAMSPREWADLPTWHPCS